ncbi:LAAT1 protein, partial [Mionectes macconnelli]|nr:LAAT1 protein [Mionectes macconnelli]
IPGSHNLRNFCISWVMVCGALCVTVLCQLLLRNQEQNTAIPRNSISSWPSLGVVEVSGFICGHISCVFCLGSRFPQLCRNVSGFGAESTEGISYLLFALAMVGNCTSGLSLVLKMPKTKSSWGLRFVHHLPWLTGSFGVLFVDIFVTLQFILSRQHKENPPALVALEIKPLLVNEDPA